MDKNCRRLLHILTLGAGAFLVLLWVGSRPALPWHFHRYNVTTDDPDVSMCVEVFGHEGPSLLVSAGHECVVMFPQSASGVSFWYHFLPNISYTRASHVRLQVSFNATATHCSGQSPKHSHCHSTLFTTIRPAQTICAQVDNGQRAAPMVPSKRASSPQCDSLDPRDRGELHETFDARHKTTKLAILDARVFIDHESSTTSQQFHRFVYCVDDAVLPHTSGRFPPQKVHRRASPFVFHSVRFIADEEGMFKIYNIKGLGQHNNIYGRSIFWHTVAWYFQRGLTVFAVVGVVKLSWKHIVAGKNWIAKRVMSDDDARRRKTH
jgi:hypothetical protein